jgi:flagellar motor switch protein FliN/FliY
VTDGGFVRADLIAAAEAAALALSKALGLGDEARVGEEWPVDDTDMVLSAVLAGDADGRLILAVNDAVGERLLGDSAVLQSAFDAATAVIAGELGVTLTCAPVANAAAAQPTVIIEITDAQVLTSLAGVILPVIAPEAPPADFEPVSFDDAFDQRDSHALAAMSVLNDVELVVTAELGRTTMAVRDLLGLSPGMVVEIDRVAGSPIDLLVNGRRIAAGEVVVIDEEFGIRITDIAPIGERRR